jgi:hypothetical protein
MTCAPLLLAFTHPPFPVLAHIRVLPSPQRPECSHRRDLWPVFPAGALGSGWEWTLGSCHRQESYHRAVVECTTCAALTLRTLSPLM